MSRPIRIAFNAPNPADACAWYRSVGPLTHLERTSDFQVTMMDDVSTYSALKADIAFFSRPNTESEIEAIHKFKQLRIPVVVDWDDDITEIPRDNPYWHIWFNPQMMANLVNGIDLADVLLVSTQALADKWKKHHPGKQIHVVKNALDERLHHSSEPGKESTICWRGTHSHQRDLQSFSGVIDDFSKANPEQRFTFFGYNPWELTEKLGRDHCHYIPPIARVPDYLIALKNLSPKFGIVPLYDCPFSRARSNIAWLELTWAGAVCLVPGWPEWETPGTLNYRNLEEFAGELPDLVHGSDLFYNSMHQQAWDYIQKNQTLGVVNPLRERIFMALLNRADWPEVAA